MAAILNIAQLQKMLNMPKVASSWFFICRVYSTRICKKTSVMSQNEVMCHILQTNTSTLQVQGSWITLGVNSDHWTSTMLSRSSEVWRRDYSRSRASLNTLNNISCLAKANGTERLTEALTSKDLLFYWGIMPRKQLRMAIFSSWYYYIMWYMLQLLHQTLFCIRLPHIFLAQ